MVIQTKYSPSASEPKGSTTQNGVESNNSAETKRCIDNLTLKSLPKGKYTLVGIDIDTTGRRLIDEIIKSKSEFAALKDFLDWLEALKAKDNSSQGIVLIYYEDPSQASLTDQEEKSYTNILLTAIVKNLMEMPEFVLNSLMKRKTELADLFDSYFDPAKTTNKPVVKINNRRQNRRIRNGMKDNGGRSTGNEHGAAGDKQQGGNNAVNLPDSTKSPKISV
ncbi:Maternal protein exuperantia-1 [Eumeta japonica]|uniref:Maternal protein exuperantia-1 n=1 Tax=Eumeta variegata TaxID=151549 RepID=A0A4C2AC55_EUMVA|nr:Maternal protein exuperantia-1 [Eumeta japonica]